MRAVRITAFGPADVLELADAPEPSPSATQVLVRLEAASVNRADLLLRAGRYHTLPALPAIPGTEGAGTVIAVGDAVAGVRPGDRVAAWGQSGFYAEAAVAEATKVVLVPYGVPSEVAAALPVAWLTARTGLRELGGLRAGQTVLIHAGASGVGSAAIQTARSDGAIVIAVVGSADKEEFVRGLGADHVLRRDRDDLVASTLELTNGRGADLVLDLAGGAAFAASLKAVAGGGRVVSVANVAGEPSLIDTRDFYPRNVAILGFQFTHRQTLGWDPRPDLAALLHEVAAGSDRVPVNSEFELAQAADAHRLVESNASRGKVVLRI